MDLYAESNLSYEVLNKFSLSFHHLKSLCIRLKIGLEVFTIGVAYRRLGTNFEQFLLEYQNCSN